MRKAMAGMAVPFNIYEFRAGEVGGTDATQSEPMKYNVGGIRMSEAAYNRLRDEISLDLCPLQFPRLWGSEETSFYSGLVPIGSDIFRRIVIRVSRIPAVETGNFSLTRWTDASIYEVCASAAVYEEIDKKLPAGTSRFSSSAISSEPLD